MNISPITKAETNFKGNVLYTPGLRTITSKADVETVRVFDELAKNIESKKDNMLYRFDIGKVKYKMLADRLEKTIEFILTKLDSKNGKTSTFTIEETTDNYSRKKTETERFSEILNIFIKHFNEEVYPTEEKKSENMYKKMIQNSIIGDKK